MGQHSYSSQLRDNVFEGVSYQQYSIYIKNNDDNNNRVGVRVTRLGGENAERRCWFLKRRMTMGQYLVDVPVGKQTRMDYHATTCSQW